MKNCQLKPSSTSSSSEPGHTSIPATVSGAGGASSSSTPATAGGGGASSSSSSPPPPPPPPPPSPDLESCCSCSCTMCSTGHCTHFHAASNRNEEYIKELKVLQGLHTFTRDGLATKVFLPHGNPIESVHVIIRGKVQLVHFPVWTWEQAKKMSINGWIRYLKDGSIEAVFSGLPAAVDRMLDRCKTGPGDARVKEIDVIVCERPPGSGFHQLPIHEYVTILHCDKKSD